MDAGTPGFSVGGGNDVSRRKRILAVARVLVTAIVASSVLVMSGDGGAANASSPPPPQRTDGVSAILLDWYGGCDVADAWATLNANWPHYGSVPVSISTTGDLCEGTFTLADLEASGADTVILDTTAAFYTLTPDEVQALQTYLDEGHTFVGEGTVFQWNHRHVNNGLAPLFGLAEQSSWYVSNGTDKSPHYKLQEQDPDAAVLLRSVANPYVSNAYGATQKPSSKKWDSAVLNGARYLAIVHSHRDAVTVYDAPAYTAIYVSSMPAFFDYSTPDDLQFLYNAIVYPNES